MSSEVVVSAEGVSKVFASYDAPGRRLRQMAANAVARVVPGEPRQRLRQWAASQGRAFAALSDISLEVARGETVGIIGRNGSGKSTLLQIIAGTVAPSAGRVAVNGRVAALLELGAGFNPEFTGRENAYLNAQLFGLTKRQVDERFEDIVAFADIGDFIDQPVKVYSSGMYVRLAFAVAAHVDADLIIVDEALAVGDVFFAQKCMRFFREYKNGGGTLLFVSHDTSAVVNLCDRAILLEGGRLIEDGSPKAICRRYLRNIYASRESPAAESGHFGRKAEAALNAGAAEPAREFWAPKQRENLISVSRFNALSDSFGLRGAEVTDAGFFGDDGRRLDVVRGGQDVCFSVFIRCDKSFDLPAVGLVIKDRLGQAVFTEGTTLAFEGRYDELRFSAGQAVRVDFLFPMPVLIEGMYSMTVAVAEGLGHDHVQHHLVHDALALRSLSSRLLHGIAGFSDLRIRMRFYAGEQQHAKSEAA